MGAAAEYLSRTRLGAHFHETRESRELVLAVVAIALLLDNMLLTTVVPIIPEFLYTIRHQHINQSLMASNSNENNLRNSPIPFPIEESSILDENQDNLGQVELDNFAKEELKDWKKKTPEEKRQRLEKMRKHYELIRENVEVGILLASKAVVQLITNPFIGRITNRIGYSIPMFCGFIIMFSSTLIFAFSRSYTILLMARALQGSLSLFKGMGMLADRYPDDEERGNAMGTALGGLALGVLIGPPFGGFMYQYFGKSAPFIVLAFLALLDGCLQMLVLQPGVMKSGEEAPSLKSLITDPYILIASGAITFANMGIAMLEPSLPIFMMDRMNAEKWQLGAAFLPASISYLIGTNLFGPLGHKIGRWLASFVGLTIIGLGLICVPFATLPNHLIIPMGLIGFGIGMVDSSMMPELGFLVDIRHSAVYGGVYAIGDAAFCLGFAIGPALSGSLVKAVGFKAMLITVGIVSIIYGPLLFMLKNPPPRTDQEKQESAHLVFGNERTTVKYTNYDEQIIGDGNHRQP